jgi:uncharacterized repeat protein (TIGR03803 family)
MKTLRFLIVIFLVALAGHPLASCAQTLTTLYQFGGFPTDGLVPYAGLVQGSDGNFYGTTVWGGTNDTENGGDGTVFKITPQGTLSTLWQFGANRNDGASPYAKVVQGSDGNFYGTTVHGGDTNLGFGYGDGTVFKITPQGTLTTLWQFNGTNGTSPYAELVQGTDGYFYGTTQQGGTNYFGTVFRITPQGTLTTLYQFGGLPTDGKLPSGGLVQGTDDNFYGTTDYGGTSTNCGGDGCGTVFKITPQGTLTTLWQFNRANGESPDAAMVQGTDGYFYGMTARSENTCGTVFKITPQGTLTTLWQFNGTNGYYPAETHLVQGTDGYLYGTTVNGGTNDIEYSGDGTVFRITPQGTLTTLYQFGGPPTDGIGPYGGLERLTQPMLDGPPAD